MHDVIAIARLVKRRLNVVFETWADRRSNTAFTRLNAPGVYLNLESWTRRLFDTPSLLELFIHEAMFFRL